MLYKLTYKDKDKKLVTEIIEAETDKKAINKVNKILEDKIFFEPFLSLEEGLFDKEQEWD